MTTCVGLDSSIKFDTSCPPPAENAFVAAFSNARKLAIKYVLTEILGREPNELDSRKVRFINHPARPGFLLVQEFVYMDICLGQIMGNWKEIVFKPHTPEVSIEMTSVPITSFTMSDLCH